MAIVDMKGISKRYPGTGRSLALDRIDLSLEPGAVLGLLGPNGAGKTTFIKILAGLLVPDAGAGTILGYDLLRQAAEIRAHVSLVAPTADVGIDNNLTVRQNLAFWAPVYGLYGSAARQRISDLLDRLNLDTKAQAWPMHLSAGQRQRLALARSLLAETPLLFLDEPTNKLDREGTKAVRELIAELNIQRGVTIVLTTHVMEEAEELCTEVAILQQGQIRQHGTTYAVIAALGMVRPVQLAFQGDPKTMRSLDIGDFSGAERVEWNTGEVNELTVWTRDTRGTTADLLAWVMRQGYRLIRIHSARVTLDDVFQEVLEPRRTP